MNYKEALAWLYGTQRFGIKLGVENVRRLFAELKVPDRNERVFHVAGTNGKGSVCAMIDSILRAQAYRTGLFTSPHLVTFRERIQINGEKISKEDTARGLSTIRDLVANWDPHPTFFEIATALGLLHFRERETEFIVLETGMGGRLDATNATQPIVSVITPIDLDHQKWLGDSLTQIAAEKAGIIKQKTPVVSAPQMPEAEKVIRARAAECDAPLEFVRQRYAGRVGLEGEHQKQNAAVAIAALYAAKITVAENAINRGLNSVNWPGRFQRWDERIIIDGAHNAAGARVLAETWQKVFPAQRASIILAVLQDKDIAGIVRALLPIARRFLLPKIRAVRALSPDQTAPIIHADKARHRSSGSDRAAPANVVSVFDNFPDALTEARAHDEKILITGSLHFAGEALAHLQNMTAVYEECLQ